MKTSIHRLFLLEGNVQGFALVSQLADLLVFHPVAVQLGKGVQLAGFLSRPSHLLLGLLHGGFLLGGFGEKGDISLFRGIFAGGVLVVGVSVFEGFSIGRSADFFFMVPRLFYSSDESSRICSSLIICSSSWSLQPPSI
jgi:hypothetical protein